MDTPKRKIGFLTGLGYSLVGALSAVISYLPLVILSALLLDFILFDLMDYGSSPNVDDFLAVMILWLPAALLGMLAGFFGAFLARKRHKKAGPWIGAVLGGVIGSLLISLWMPLNIYIGWINTYNEQRESEMRPEEDAPIPLLDGDFKEITTVPDFGTLAVSPDGNLLAIATLQETRLYDLEQRAAFDQPLAGDSGVALSLDFSSDSRWLAAGTTQGNVILWSVPEMEPVYILDGHTDSVKSVAVNSLTNIVASVDYEGTVIIWNLVDGQEISRLQVEAGPAQCLDISPDGGLLAVCNYKIGRFEVIDLWEVINQEVMGHLSLPDWSNGSLWHLSFSPDGSLLAGGALFGPVVWDVETRQPLGATHETQALMGIDFSADSRWLVFTSEADIYIYDARTMEPVGRLTGPAASLSQAWFLPSGQILAMYYPGGSESQIGIWDFEIP